jgi:cytochrome c oxidase subunit 4
MKPLFLTYFALMILLTCTVAAVYIPLTSSSALVPLSIAIIKALLVAYFFMELRTSLALIRLTAGAALLWLFFLYFLAATDVQFRPDSSPVDNTSQRPHNGS